MKKKIVVVLILQLIFFSLNGQINNYLYVANITTRVLKSPSAFSPVIENLSYLTAVKTEKILDNWILVETPSKNRGYICKDSLINESKMKRQFIILGIKDHDGIKKFTEESEISAGTKGFTKIESKQMLKYPKYKYHLVDKYEKEGFITNPQSKFKEFREKGKLGEFYKE